MREVISSAAKAEVGSTTPRRHVPNSSRGLDHKQPSTTLQVDNMAAAGIANEHRQEEAMQGYGHAFQRAP
jgi:hypothetical protein